jgi:protein-arginine kinase activator protein McsA
MGAAKKKAEKEKPLEKMTAKELRDMAKEIPGISGVHGMNKTELISEIKRAKGIKEEGLKAGDATVREIKKKIRTLKGLRRAALEAEDREKATVLRRRISRLKKRTHKAA